MIMGFVSTGDKHLRYLNSALLVMSQVGVSLQAIIPCPIFQGHWGPEMLNKLPELSRLVTKSLGFTPKSVTPKTTPQPSLLQKWLGPPNIRFGVQVLSKVPLWILDESCFLQRKPVERTQSGSPIKDPTQSGSPESRVLALFLYLP